MTGQMLDIPNPLTMRGGVIAGKTNQTHVAIGKATGEFGGSCQFRGTNGRKIAGVSPDDTPTISVVVSSFADSANVSIQIKVGIVLGFSL